VTLLCFEISLDRLQSGSQQNPIYVSVLPIRATCPAHPVLLDLVIPITLGEECKL
jgi:hypothetical protein